MDPGSTKGRCWGDIGIWGDATCPELFNVIHCHNCPTYTAAAQRFFARQKPQDYLADWLATVMKEQESGRTDATSVLVFRLGTHWFALPTGFIREIAGSCLVHSVPQYRKDACTGLVNIRGELLLCISLPVLLGLDDAIVSRRTSVRTESARLVVVENANEDWAFMANGIRGIERLFPEDLGEPPASVAKTVIPYLKGTIMWPEQQVHYLDVSTLLQAVRRCFS